MFGQTLTGNYKEKDKWKYGRNSTRYINTECNETEKMNGYEKILGDIKSRVLIYEINVNGKKKWQIKIFYSIMLQYL